MSNLGELARTLRFVSRSWSRLVRACIFLCITAIVVLVVSSALTVGASLWP
jgi:hypothetical protein